MIARVTMVGVLALAGLWPSPASAQQAPMGELVDRSALRVCADPNNLPFSNDKGQGFENEIADLIAARLGVPVSYTWYPQTMGFVRNTLRAHLCDLVMGVASANELVQNTNPYYRSTYVLARRATDDDRYADLDSPAVADARIGVIARTPPADLLARRGLMAQAQPYHLMVDTRFDNPGREMIEDLAANRIDVALLWGPIAGYWASQQDEPITLVPLVSDRPGNRLDFRISMGVRPGEPVWKHDLNQLIAELQPQINGVLERYHVPLMDGRGALVAAHASPPTPAVPTVAEPDGYRTERYRAPTPGTLEGATVLDTAALKELIATGEPVLVDVLSKRVKTKAEQAAWQPPPRKHLPGSVWLPNVGFGTLSPEFMTYFDEELAIVTEGDRKRPVVFYCDANCWMGYNAAKRALGELGYGNVYWYPDGVQGWREEGLELVEAEPVPMPQLAQGGVAGR